MKLFERFVPSVLVTMYQPTSKIELWNGFLMWRKYRTLVNYSPWKIQSMTKEELILLGKELYIQATIQSKTSPRSSMYLQSLFEALESFGLERRQQSIGLIIRGTTHIC